MYIYWIHGLYSTVVFGHESRGGLVRTRNAQFLLKSIIPSAELINVVVKPPFKKAMKQTINHGLLEFPLKRSQVFLRSISKLFRKLFLLRNLGIGIGSLSTCMECEKLLQRIPKSKEYMLVIDSIRGYMSIRQIFDDIAHDSLAVLYLSHNYEPEFIGSKILWDQIEEVEKRVIRNSDLVLAASMRDFKIFKYRYGLNGQKIVFLPNIYPLNDLKIIKFCSPSISLILPDNWGITNIKNVISFISRSINMSNKVKNVIIIGKIASVAAQRNDWGRAIIKSYGFIKSRKRFLETIGKAHIGINYAFRTGGTNVKKYDYALTKQIILSNVIGARGDLLPYEYTFIDEYDLASKIDQLFNENYLTMGEQNFMFAYKTYKTAKEDIKRKLVKILE